MNLRKNTHKYLGWCPGFKSAARFIPDREIPPSRIAVALFAGALVFFTSFLAAQQLQLIFGGAREPLRLINSNPHLVVADGQLYLFVTVSTTATQLHDSTISRFRVKLDIDGLIWDKIETPAVGDILVTKEGVWYMGYASGGVKVIWSEDGVEWKGPVTIAENKGKNGFLGPPLSGEGYIRFQKPKLTEMGDGRLFLSFTRSVLYNLSTLGRYDFVNRSLKAHYSIMGHDGEWSPPIHIPVLIPDSHISLGRYGSTNIYWKTRDIAPLEPSSFTLKDGKVGIVAVDMNASDWSENGIWFTAMNENGAWSPPRHIFLYRGRNPQMFYSPSRDGYFLIYENYETDVVEVTFTPDLETFSGTTSFQGLMLLGKRLPSKAIKPSMAELSDGTTVMVYESFPDLYITSSQNGMDWTPPKKVEGITSEHAMETAKSQQNTYISVLTGSALSFAAVVIALNIFGRGKILRNQG